MHDPHPEPEDLAGSVDERQEILALLAAGSVSAEWLRRQLDNALAAWSAAETQLEIWQESHSDY